MIRLDREYTVRKNLALDLTIIAKTIPALCIQLGDVVKARRSASAKKRRQRVESAPAENPVSCNSAISVGLK